MGLIGFVLSAIGLMVALGARRIVFSKVKLDEADRKEMELLAKGGIIAVRLAGIIVAVVGVLFLLLQNA